MFEYQYSQVVISPEAIREMSESSQKSVSLVKLALFTVMVTFIAILLQGKVFNLQKKLDLELYSNIL